VGVLQGLCSYNGLLYAAWKGETEDDRLFFSEFNGSYWTEQRLVGGNSSAGPAIANFGGKMMLAWKGEFSDERQFFLPVDNGLWGAQAQIPGVASSTGAGLAEFDNLLYAAWKGAGSDQAIWYATYDGANWSQQQTIPGVATAFGPAVCAFNGRLYAAWRGWNNDQALWYASFDGVNWSNQQIIPGVASSVGPSLAVFDGRLFAAWKGVTGDEAIWFTSFDGNSWTPQQPIPNVGSSIGPALSEYAGKLYAMWKGADDDQGLYYSSFDGAQWVPQDRIPGNTGQDVPQNMGLRMQFQETTLWCWIAVGVSVAHYYGHTSATQCGTMTTIGLSINNWTLGTNCCPTTAMEQANPDLLGKLLNPYDKNAEYALENVGIPAVCIKTGGVNTALDVTNNFAGARQSMTLEEVAAEINAGRPVVATIQWTTGNGGEHFVAIAGVLNDALLVCDPISGETIIGYEDFPAEYGSGATLVDYCLTKPG
jgi:hypothetical protein